MTPTGWALPMSLRLLNTAFELSMLLSQDLEDAPAPGATGNVATEDVLYALADSQYSVKGFAEGGIIDLDEMVRIGSWISNELGRKTVSRAGRALGFAENFEEKKTLQRL
jgi:hypothetical protein